MIHDEILNLPADQLPEVAARVMGKRADYYDPMFFSHNDAREFAEWALPKIHEDKL